MFRNFIAAFSIIGVFSLYAPYLIAQNVGIGTSNPQQKLHVAGNVRVDGLAGTPGIMKYDYNGDLVPLPNTNSNGVALLGTGNWGIVPGTLPSGALVASVNFRDSALLSRGFYLYGSLPSFNTFLNTNAPYPAGEWLPTYTTGDYNKGTVPEFDQKSLMFWADSILIHFINNVFYAYNPVTDDWRIFGNNPTAFTASMGSKSVWTGTEWIVWGGYFNNGNNNGFRYNPVTKTFLAIPTTNQPEARTEFALHYSANKLIVWGGVLTATGTYTNTGGMLDLTSNTWVATSMTNVPSIRRDFTSVRNTSNQSILVWGGNAGAGVTNSGAALNPSSNTWTALSTTNAPAAREGHTAIWTGTEMIVASGRVPSTPSYIYLNSGGRYNPATNTWATISSSGAPALGGSASIWTGTKMLVMGGTSNSLPITSESYYFDPATNAWSFARSMSISPANPTVAIGNNMVFVFSAVQQQYDAYSQTMITRLFSNRGTRLLLAPATVSNTVIGQSLGLYLYRKS